MLRIEHLINPITPLGFDISYTILSTEFLDNAKINRNNEKHLKPYVLRALLNNGMSLIKLLAERINNYPQDIREEKNGTQGDNNEINFKKTVLTRITRSKNKEQ